MTNIGAYYFTWLFTITPLKASITLIQKIRTLNDIIIKIIISSKNYKKISICTHFIKLLNFPH